MTWHVGASKEQKEKLAAGITSPPGEKLLCCVLTGSMRRYVWLETEREREKYVREKSEKS